MAHWALEACNKDCSLLYYNVLYYKITQQLLRNIIIVGSA